MNPPPPCVWMQQNELLQSFHDHEWGEPVADPDILFEYLVLHTFQLGFDFPVVLRRREAFRELLAGFEPERLARFGEAEVAELMQNPRIIRNRRKLEATLQNARAWLRLREEVGGPAGLLPFFYNFVGGSPLDTQRTPDNPPPPSTPASLALSQELKRRGFVMTGPVACYNIMQTAGLVNDHLTTCPRHAECRALAEG
ncbi:DNA-3-methyladenine glycosylase I [Hymenobacter luteus]|uniref:DNA-3-methyladenine glycosylase I n=2 Tax=Hymenobacter TaxID=89966 RepID=A0A7W9T1L0_9BACT|nr:MULTISPECIES: DNA-3-methyladenine glycosylase I [Hymenobacter]MBB4601650.1 DNA-3-methyladenine glycosylase I [Hymenobacter latericoloratus]MBB6059922.1 DNA-3-methyladenine glycosylase I [Hymenobacter luteus]